MATTDGFGFRHSVTDPSAVAAFEAATRAVLSHRVESAASIDLALRLAPAFPAAHAVRGLAALMLARPELVPQAREALAQATAAPRPSQSERAMIAALGAVLADGPARGAEILLDHVRGTTGEALPIKIAQTLFFMAGRPDGMLALTTNAMDAWDGTLGGFGFVLGCHAFSLEEAGRLDEALEVGDRAVGLEPGDVWGAHAVAHVFETAGRCREGRAWIDRRRTTWSACNNFRFHMAWHLALCHLGEDDAEAALRLYDGQVRPVPTDDYRDVANAASLLWRLRQDGIAVGDRWAELAAIARQRRHETGLCFAALHRLLAALAAGEAAVAADIVQSLEAAGGGSGEQAQVARAVALPLARVLIAPFGAGRSDGLARLAGALPALGGSHIQRDVFLRELILRAQAQRDHAAVAALLAIRRRLKRDDRFATGLAA